MPNKSELEAQVEVLLAFAEIEAAVGLAVRNVVSRVAGPHVVPEQGNVALCAHALGTQGPSGFLGRGFVEEVRSKDTVVLLKGRSLQVILDGSEVHVVV